MKKLSKACAVSNGKPPFSILKLLTQKQKSDIFNKREASTFSNAHLKRKQKRQMQQYSMIAHLLIISSSPHIENYLCAIETEASIVLN